MREQTIEERCGQCGQMLTGAARAFMLDEFGPQDDDDDWDHTYEPPDPLRYVEPKWVRLDDDEQLHECAGCNRFFVVSVPIMAFLGEGEHCLNIRVCDECAPKLLGSPITRA